MKIENFGTETVEKRARVFGTVKWEDCDRPDQTIYIDTDTEFSDALSVNPHSFLIGGILPAMHFDEARVHLDASVCPELLDGLLTVMSWIKRWWYLPNKKIPIIETKIKSEPTTSQRPKRAGLFFSGGIDSLATIRCNRSNYSLNHPQSIQDGLLVYGLEVDDPEAFKFVMNSVATIARDCQITLIPVYTNLRDLNTDWVFWRRSFQGAVFSAIAHAFSQRLNVASISSSHCVCYSPPYGSHPLIDPNFSSCDFRIKHTCFRLSRLDKTKILANWDVALKNLRVCNKDSLYQPNQLNCGSCEKCLITMTGLIAIGALERTSAFGRHDVSADQLKANIRIYPDVEHYYEELIIPLIERGREDLAHVIKVKLKEYKRKFKPLKLLRSHSVVESLFRFRKYKNYLNKKRFFKGGREQVHLR
jgi:hypothetical protein